MLPKFYPANSSEVQNTAFLGLAGQECLQIDSFYVAELCEVEGHMYRWLEEALPECS